MSEIKQGDAKMAFELVEEPPAVIKVIGVGGGGGNAVERMASSRFDGVEFIAVNTDFQALEKLSVPNTLKLGEGIRDGLGAGTNPEVGRSAALQDSDRIHQAVTGADMLFITAGMGGGTGTGAAPVVAQIAKGLDILTVAVVTKPFELENRTRTANEGISELRQHVDSLIAIPNDKLLEVLDDDISLADAFAVADEVLRGAVQGIADIIIRSGTWNVDFADVRTVMSEGGMAIMGTGQATGEDRARQAVEQAIHSPLLDDVDLRGARGVVANVTAASLGLREFQTIGNTVRELAAKDGTVVFGSVEDPDLGDELRVTVVATGLGGPRTDIDRPEIAVDNTVAAGPARAGRSGYEMYEQPTALRQRTAGGVAESPMDNILDIPSFLRRQAD